MSSEKFVLGVDVGSSNIKCMLFSLKGEVVAESSREVTELYPAEYHIEQDPQEIWTQFCAAVQSLMRESGVNPQDVAGIGFDSNRCALLLLDEAYQPISNIVTWRDTRSEAYVERFARQNSALSLYHITGEDGRAQHTLFKVLWYQEQLPEVWQSARHILFSPKDYLFYRLLGRTVTSKSMAQSTGLFDINSFEYSRPILQYAGIDSAMLPQLEDSNAVIGHISAEMALMLGLAEGTPLICGLCDATASQVGSGAIASGSFTISIGTCGAIRTFSDAPRYDDSMFSQIRLVPPYGYVPSCTVSDAGSVLKWYRNQFCRWEEQKSRTAGQDVYDYLDVEAAKIPPGSEGLLMLPTLTGGSYAFKNVDAFGNFAGIRNYHTHAHFTRAILEGVAYSLKTVLGRFQEAGYPLQQVRLGGGGSKSDLWSKIITDILDIPIATLECEEASCLGSAIMAALGLGFYKTLEEAVGEMVRVKHTHTPNKACSDIYRNMYLLYTQLNQTLESYYTRHRELSSALANNMRDEGVK